MLQLLMMVALAVRPAVAPLHTRPPVSAPPTWAEPSFDGSAGGWGVRESQVLEANGRAEAIKQLAAAEAFQRVTLAEGEAQSIERVFRAIHDGDPTPDLLAFKYLETLGTIANGQATKIFMPLEASGALASLGALGEVFNTSPAQDTEPN